MGDFFHTIGAKILAGISGIILLVSGAGTQAPANSQSPSPSVQPSAITQPAPTEASGTAPSPSRYQITVVNDYFADPIKLIAGSRFENEDGGIFRSESAFTVPGKVGTKNGSIAISVVAEKTGSAPSDRLTLPGLVAFPTQYAHIYALGASAPPATADAGAQPTAANPPASAGYTAGATAPLVVQSSGNTGVSEATLSTRLSILKNDLLSRIAQLSSGGGGYAQVYVNNPSGDFVTRDFLSKQTDAIFNSMALMSRIDQLTGTKLSKITVDGVTGLTDADIPDSITASSYLPLTGGTIAGDLTVTGAFSGGALSLANASTTLLSVLGPAYFGTTATSTFGADGSLTLATALTAANGGTGASSFGQGWIFSSGGTAALTASTSPTVN